jgi:DNA-binding PucR family transcriptional regulator
MADEAEVRQALERLIATIRPRFTVFAAEQVTRIRANVPPGAVPEDEWFWNAVQRSYSANVALALDLVAAGARDVPEELPVESVELARVAARAGLPPDTISTVFRTGQSRFWEAWREAIEGLGLSPELTLAVIDEVMDFGTRYMAWTAQEVAARYLHELETREDTLFALVRQVLDGRAAQDAQLGYALHGRHLALFVTGPRSREAVTAFATEFGRRPLVVAPDQEAAWAWLSEQAEPDARRTRNLSKIAAGLEVTLGVGSTRTTIQGFRRSHEEARIAARCAASMGEPVAVYADVLPEALALGDAQAAEELVARTLGPLGKDKRGQRLRETLRAYCATGNGASAASQLGVSRRTLTYRVAEIERRLGTPLAARRTEIDLALRLERLLAGLPAA